MCDTIEVWGVSTFRKGVQRMSDFELHWFKRIITFRPSCGEWDASDVGMGIMLWLLILLSVAMILALVWQVVYTIYRVIAYDYEEINLPAEVAHKSYKPSHTTYVWAGKSAVPISHSARYSVHIVTSNGFKSVIDSEKLYRWAKKGAWLRVTLKVGRSRKADREIKYWRIINYSW